MSRVPFLSQCECHSLMMVQKAFCDPNLVSLLMEYQSWFGSPWHVLFCSLIMTGMAHSLSFALPPVCRAPTSPELLFKCFPPWLPCKQLHPPSWVSSSPPAYIPYWHIPFLTHLLPFPLMTMQESRKTFPLQLSQKLDVCLLDIVFMLPQASSIFLPPQKKNLELWLSQHTRSGHLCQYENYKDKWQGIEENGDLLNMDTLGKGAYKGAQWPEELIRDSSLNKCRDVWTT